MEPITNKMPATSVKVEDAQKGVLGDHTVTTAKPVDMITISGISTVAVSIGVILAILGGYELFQAYHNHKKNREIQAIVFTSVGWPLILFGCAFFLYFMKKKE